LQKKLKKKINIEKKSVENLLSYVPTVSTKAIILQVMKRIDRHNASNEACRYKIYLSCPTGIILVGVFAY